MHAQLFLFFLKIPPIASFGKKFNSWKWFLSNIYISFILICMKNTEYVYCGIKSFECSNCNSVERKEHYRNKFSNGWRESKSPSSFLLVLEFIIRIGNAKTLVSAIYMLISIFGSSFIGIGLLGIILSHTFTYAIITIYILNFKNTK